MYNPFKMEMEDDGESGDDDFLQYVTTEEDLLELERRFAAVQAIEDPAVRLEQAKALVAEMVA